MYFILPCRHLNKRKTSILLYYNGLDVSLFVIHDSEMGNSQN